MAIILKRHPNAHVYLIGANREQLQPWMVEESHERLHFMGIVEDPSIFRTAADIYC